MDRSNLPERRPTMFQGPTADLDDGAAAEVREIAQPERGLERRRLPRATRIGAVDGSCP
ncbi:hypothetical protein [Nannocystis pusilla]|uniref:hypothetical protein n=1 Tax=Nannocystis pusilla TaxID=889268 RepID=UPI003B7F6BE9